MCTKYIHLLGVKPGKVGAVWKMGNSHSSHTNQQREQQKHHSNDY